MYYGLFYCIKLQARVRFNLFLLKCNVYKGPENIVHLQDIYVFVFVSLLFSLV